MYNVVAVQRGKKNPNRYIIMSGDIDSRISDPTNYIDDSPGANDNASGMAGTIEAARVLSKYKFDNSIIYVGLSGCLLYTSPSPRDRTRSRMPSSA